MSDGYEQGERGGGQRSDTGHDGHNVFAPLLWTHEAFDFSPQPWVRTDRKGIIGDANPAASLLLSCPKKFLTGKPLGLFVAPGHRHRFYHCLTKFWHGCSGDSFETRLSRSGMSARDVAVSVTIPPKNDASIYRGGVYIHWWFTDVTERKRAEDARDDLLRRLVTVQEDERRRVSRELHDSVGQLLTALALTIKAARDAAPLPPVTDNRLGEVQKVADELSRVVHNLATRLRPTSLDDVGLHDAIAQFLNAWSTRTGITVEYEAVGIETVRLGPDIETTIFRLVQEAMTNVARHAKANRVDVVISRQDSHVTVAVEDDGVGFDVDLALASDRLGLIGMRERAVLAGGKLDIESRPGGGTAVLASIPLQVQ